MAHEAKPLNRNIHNKVKFLLQSIVGIGLALSVYEQQWLNVALIAGILIMTLLPSVIGRRFGVYIPPELELLAIAFIFAALFLGETRGFYQRFWWWDLALHTTSGGLLGIFGVLLVYVLNEQPRISLHMKPGFVALFAFTFSMAIGALWEIFEFTMDRTLGLRMQKPMFDDPSGLTDTMWDLIVDALGALIVSIAGYAYMKSPTDSFVQRWIEHFVERNPHLFQRPRK